MHRDATWDASILNVEFHTVSSKENLAIDCPNTFHRIPNYGILGFFISRIFQVPNPHLASKRHIWHRHLLSSAVRTLRRSRCGEARERGRAVTAVTLQRKRCKMLQSSIFGEMFHSKPSAIGDPPFMETLISDSHTISCL